MNRPYLPTIDGQLRSRPVDARGWQDHSPPLPSGGFFLPTEYNGVAVGTPSLNKGHLCIRATKCDQPSTMTSAFTMAIDLDHAMPAHAVRVPFSVCTRQRCHRAARVEPAKPACSGRLTRSYPLRLWRRSARERAQAPRRTARTRSLAVVLIGGTLGLPLAREAA